MKIGDLVKIKKSVMWITKDMIGMRGIVLSVNDRFAQNKSDRLITVDIGKLTPFNFYRDELEAV